MSAGFVRYTLVSPEGNLQSGRVRADELESILSLANQGYEILELEEEKASPENSGGRPSAPAKPSKTAIRRNSVRLGPKLSSLELKYFTLNLSELLSAGVNLLDAITAIQNNDPGLLGNLARRLAIEIQSGHSLSNALDRSIYSFDRTFIGMIRIGEESGKLPTVLAQLHKRVARNEELQRSLVQASIYPATLVVACILLLAFVGLFVVPSILPIIESITDEVPWPTQILLFIHGNGWKFLLMTTAALACLPWLWSSNPAAVSARQWLKYESPLFGTLARTQEINQFCSDFALLLNSGVNIVKSLGFICFDDLALEAAKQRVMQRIVDGDSLTEAFESEPIFPRLLPVLLRVAEESGANLADILQHQSQLLEFEAEENKQALSRLFEPILIGTMGVIVGVVLLAVFLPIYSQLAANL